MHPKDLRIEDHTYHLPDERIAKHPLQERDASKLLIYRGGEIMADTYRNIATHIQGGSRMVFNQTKVVHARLLFKKPSGSTIEVFCLAPESGDIHTSMLQRRSVQWECLVGGASKWKQGMVLTMQHEAPGFTLSAKILARTSASYVVNLEWDNDTLTFAEVLHYTGKIPLPPYLHREAIADDEERYQTLYAKNEGSVAAPTAGLHFTPGVMKSLADKGIETSFVTLHVGAGTFRPVKSETMAGHDMHAEWIDLDVRNINELLDLSKEVIAVGTTSLRTLESLYWIGSKLINNGEIDFQQIAVSQWEPYDCAATATRREALDALIAYMRLHKIERLVTRTQILIAPGYTFRIADALVTNFHQPQSTLLLLVAAFIGEDWRKVYDYAMEHEFRFLSYGDGCLLYRGKSL